ncbi:MAG: (d)CMP kinase [Anaerolineales bacterium]|nr:(d)CMP kinase [Anaerolineales bacterium]
MNPSSQIAIDGPAASGKSTIGQRLAARLGYLYFDTGVMYRAATLAALERGVPAGEEAGVTSVARRISIDVRPPSAADGRQYDVLLDGRDVTWAIRTPEVEARVSQVSMYPGVRTAMGERQREIGLRGRVVMVGRDIGTVILPEAGLKIYLDASVEERARRRCAESVARGEPADFEETLAAMRERDRVDSTRQLAPLRPASDAVVLDTTGMSIDDVVERVVALADRAPEGRSVKSPQAGGTERSMESKVDFPWKVRCFRAVARPAFRLLFHILCRVEIVGRENVPRSGGYLICGNHLSIVDPPLVVAFWPRAPEAAGAVDVLDRPFQGQLMRWYGGMSVHRGEADRALLDEMVRRLRAGLPVIMDPEGRRSHVPGMQEAHPGAAYVAARAGVPIVPVGVTGTETAIASWKRGRRGSLRMVIGKPITLPPVELRSASRRKDLRANTNRIMHAVAALLPEEYRGVYR